MDSVDGGMVVGEVEVMGEAVEVVVGEVMVEVWEEEDDDVDKGFKATV